jgi:hypothetical protein
MMPESRKGIFLSYASQDTDVARRIGDALRQAGLEVWFDQSELRGGDAWDELIRRQIAECALFIPIISASTARRLEGYFRLEWSLADQRTQRMARTKTFIVPVCVDSTPESASDVPESFVRVQWSRLPGGVISPAFIERVSSLLSEGRSPSAAPVTSPAPPAPSPQTLSSGTLRVRRNWPLLIGAAAAVLALAILAWIRLRVPQVTPSLASSPPIASRTAATESFRIPDKSIAVLPFVDMSEKKDQEYFSDGLSEELLDLLAQVPDLRVAFHWLDRGFHVHDGGLIYLKYDRFLAGLRADPRYAALLKRLNLPP